jgi:hypothetical protein
MLLSAPSFGKRGIFEGFFPALDLEKMGIFK